MKQKIKSIKGCFIHSTNPKIIVQLESFGYQPTASLADDEKPDCIVVMNQDNKYYLSYYDNEKESNDFVINREKKYVDCRDNEDLFLAIAALNNDNDYYQWFTNYYNAWILCETNEWEEYIEQFPPYKEYHKASVEELIVFYTKQQGKKCSFTWYPENAAYLSDDEYSDPITAIESAKSMFKKQIGTFYGYKDKRYSPRICVGEVIPLDWNALSNACVCVIEDTLDSELDYFTLSSELKHKIKWLKNRKEAKSNLEKFIKDNFVIYPIKKTRNYNGVYDLLLETWIDE